MDAKPADGPAEEKKLAARAEREAATEERMAAKEERQAANAPATQEKPAAAKAEKPPAKKEKPPAKEEKPPAKAEKVEKPPAKAAAPAAEEAPLDKEAAKEARIAERKEATREKIEADKASGKICDHLCQANKIRDATPGAEQITHDDGEKPGGEPNILDDDDPLKIAAQAYLKAGRDLHNGLHGEAYVMAAYKKFAEILRTRPDAQPRLLVSEGCSGSTELIGQIHKMLNAHGKGIMVSYNDECFKCDKNPECHAPGQETVAMQRVVAYSVMQGRVLVVKTQSGSGPAGKASEGPLKAMREMGARPMLAYRSNTIAKMLCEVRDCFVHSAGLKRTMYELVGPNEDACFARRALPSNKQTKVWIDPTKGKLVSTLKSLESTKDSMYKLLQTCGWAKGEYAELTTESLYESEGDKSEGAFARTVGAWTAALHSLGIKSEKAKIEHVLKEGRGQRPTTALSEAISNAFDVGQALANETEYSHMFGPTLMDSVVE